MADVFVSYKREDESRVAGIVEGLRRGGLCVAWDVDIPGGVKWRQTLLEHLDSASCVIVVWSETAVGPAGEFVQDEADRAKARGVLLPVRIDGVVEPLGFGQIQSVDLIDWDGAVEDPRFLGLIGAAREMIAGGLSSARRTPRRGAGVEPHLLTRLLGLVPAYVSDLLGLTSAPKRFIADQLARQKSRWQEGLLFLTFSFMLTFAIELPLVGASPLLELASDTAFVIAGTVLFGYAGYVAWRMVGATATIQQFFTVHFYVAGVLKLMMTATYVGLLGVLRAGDAALYQELTAGMAKGDMLRFLRDADRMVGEHPAWRVALLVAVGGWGAMLGWVAVTWGAYRALTGLSRPRSAVAFLLFGGLCLPVIIGLFIAASALTR
jgi:hypothetical protein